jgi:hypothetical protein
MNLMYSLNRPQHSRKNNHHRKHQNSWLHRLHNLPGHPSGLVYDPGHVSMCHHFSCQSSHSNSLFDVYLWFIVFLAGGPGLEEHPVKGLRFSS